MPYPMEPNLTLTTERVIRRDEVRAILKWWLSNEPVGGHSYPWVPHPDPVIPGEVYRAFLSAKLLAERNRIEVEIGPPPMEPQSTPYPQKRSTCRWCGGVIYRDGPNEPWTRNGIAGTTSTQCQDAPNPEDGPMPPHEPGPAVLGPPR